MNYLVFIIGALSGAAGAWWALWARTRREMNDNIRLRHEAAQAYGNGYQDGFVARRRMTRELNKVAPGLVLFVNLGQKPVLKEAGE